MKIARLLCVIWVCAPLALEASAAGSPASGGSSVAAMGQAAGGSAPARDTSIQAGRAETHESTPLGSAKAGHSKGRDAVVAGSPRNGSVARQRGAGQLARSNAARLHALLSAKARGRRTAASNPARPTHGATGNRMAGGSRSSSPLAERALPASKLPAPSATSVKAVARGSRIGGPQTAGPGRLGGPTIGRTANSATINGTQLHRKF
jgi:hypothetical protein